MNDNEENFRPFFSSGFKSCTTSSSPKAIQLNKNVNINKYISMYLKDYQIEGVRFLYNAYLNNRGCILADDMGLGKTVQVIAFIAAVLDKTGNPSDLDNTRLECIRKQLNISSNETKHVQFLVVCPASIIDNWIKEFNTWGYFSICKFHGNESERIETLKRLEHNRCEIILSTHETCSRHIDRLKSLKFAAVIVDEFHKMKNEKTDVAKHLREFETLVRIGLSGTILQNDPCELWSLVDWVNPDSMGTKAEFNLTISKPIKTGHRQNATKSDLRKFTKSISLLESLNKEVILRRTKELISNQLPKKTDQIVYCKLTDFQMKIYKKLIESADFVYLNTKCDACPCQKFNLKKRDCCFEELKMKEKTMQLAFINIFLKIANHPALLLSETAHVCHEYISKNLPEVLDQKLISEFNNPDNCGKMKILIKMLEAIHLNKTNKVLIFSYSMKLLDIIQSIISLKRYNFVRLDGTTKNKDRQSIVDNFNNNQNIFIFLISTKAGGVGLNITSANVVIIFDPNWNPTHDLQAQDRAYRLGQLKDVYVYRLISSGCLEENIYLRQIYKMHLNKECVEQKNTKRLFQLSRDTKRGELFGLKNLFNLNSNRNECMTYEILKRYSTLEKGIAGIDVATFISPEHVNNRIPTNNIQRDGCLDENYYDDHEDEKNDDDDDDEEAEDFEAKINNVLKKNDVVHVHMNKDLIKSSKVESHLRTASKTDLNSNSDQYAFDCNIRPDLSTLDCIEIEEEDFSLMNRIEQGSHNRITLKSGTVVQYDNVPEEIRNNKTKSPLTEIETNNSIKRLKTNDYEYIETLNDVMDLIYEDEQVNEIKNEVIYNNEALDEDEFMFQNFMKHNESILSQKKSPKKELITKYRVNIQKDSNEMNSCGSNSFKQSEIQENIKNENKSAKKMISNLDTQEKDKTKPDSKEDTGDKYDKMFDDLFN